MNRSYEKMSFSIQSSTERIVDAMMNYVLEVGEDFSDYHRDEFGIDEEDDEDVKVLKVLDIFNNGGCYFPVTDSCQVDENSGWYSYAFHCLYVVEQDGERFLKYYMLWNGGKEYDSDVSEPDHDCVITLPLQVLGKLFLFMGKFDMDVK